ncbi:nuclear transport factor 2 family protein [Gracilimonas sp.]|uniref:nuclear transport factor 2 family protein n=1 Tax=Gracilimonas sp. TaxID=1974203 RepID=UPI0032EF8CA1
MNRVLISLPTFLALISIALLTSCTQVNPQQEKEALTKLLGEFLENVDDPKMHDRLWAEDLVYTGSAGTRHGKDVIMDGMQESESETSQSAGPKYSYDSLHVKVFGKTAALTFRLIAETPDDTLCYLNSGFFEKRDGKWKAVVWQATRMADSSDD